MSKKHFLVLLAGILACGLAPALWAEGLSAEESVAIADSRPAIGVPDTTAAADTTAALAGEKGEAPAMLAGQDQVLPWNTAPSWSQPSKVNVAGCSAEALCVHTPPIQVTCTSPINGTCSSSGAHCGLVTCNGTTTYCPGYCLGDQHCARFCNLIQNPNSYCNEGCCECVP